MERLLRDNLLGAILVHRGLVTEEQLALGLQVQEREGGWRKLGDVLLDLGYVSPAGLNEALEIQRRMAEEVLARLESPRPLLPRPEPGRDRLLLYFQDRDEGNRWSWFLQFEGYLLDQAPSAEAVLQQIQQRSYALLLMEISVPELLRVPVMARQLDPELVTVAVVDYALFRSSRRGLWTATPYYLLSPFEQEELLLVLGQALERRHLRLENQLLREQIELRGQELALLTELGTRLAVADDLAQALTHAMFRTVDIFGSQAGWLLMVEEASGELRYEVMVGGQVAPLRLQRIPLGQGVCGWVAEKGQPLLVAEAQQDPRFQVEAERLPGLEVRSVLCVPIRALGRTVGVIEVIDKADRTPFTPWDQRLLTAIATLVGGAIERDRLRRALGGRPAA
jgi:putative methionine-R-sulfoxide reductase with GAF domain/CheY-like chemotaxis protein